MATIKSHTDIPQSKKLTEILSTESADMYYLYDEKMKMYDDYPRLITDTDELWDNDTPAWSLAALLNVLPPIEGFRPIIDLDINLIRYEGNYRDKLCFNGDNLVDVCYKMIVCLNELNLL